MDTGIFITGERLKSLPSAEQQYLFGLVTGATAPLRTEAPGGQPPAVTTPVNATVDGRAGDDQAGDGDRDDDFAELSPRQARDFYLGCGDKTKKAVEAIAKSSGPKFQLADVAAAVGVEAGELRGVWGGLTRRTTTVVGEGAYLIHWHDGTQSYDAAGTYVDQVGEVTEMTHQSFRKALKL